VASPFVTDLVALFTPVSAQITTERVGLGLPALICPPHVAGVVGSLMIGQEWLRREHSPPRIVLVPTGARYEHSRRPGVQPISGRVAEVEPKFRFTRWLSFEAHLWGDPDLSGTNGLQDFNACIELERELLTALYDNCGGTPNIRHSDSRIEQPSQDLRFGRLWILPFAIGTPVVDLSNVVLPFATATTAGVQVDTTVQANFPDGSSTEAGVIIAPPP